MKTIRHWALAVLLGIVLIFALQNIATVEVQFLFWSFKASRFLIVITSCLIGVVIGWMLKAHGFARHRDEDFERD